jgi:hypothetical protein
VLARAYPAKRPRARVWASLPSVLARKPKLAAHEEVCRGEDQYRVTRAGHRLVERLREHARGFQTNQQCV